MRRLATILIVCAVTAVTTGCASSPSRFYTLSPTEVTTAPPASSYSVSVGPVSLPEVVNRSAYCSSDWSESGVPQRVRSLGIAS